jgi:hypothetical protein
VIGSSNRPLWLTEPPGWAGSTGKTTSRVGRSLAAIDRPTGSCAAPTPETSAAAVTGERFAQPARAGGRPSSLMAMQVSGGGCCARAGPAARASTGQAAAAIRRALNVVPRRRCTSSAAGQDCIEHLHDM